MALRLATAIEHRRRIRRAVRHIEARLLAQPDAPISVPELADVACISRFHFIRLYQHAVHETPQATVRRLKLKAARWRLAAVPSLSVTEAALDAGYESTQAFARAYRQQFGSVPSARTLDTTHDSDVSAAIVRLPPLQVRTMAVEKSWEGAWRTYDELIAHLDAADIPQRSQEMFGVLSPDREFNQACAFENAAVHGLASFAQRRLLEGGEYVCLSGQPDAVWQRLSQDEALGQARSDDRPLLLRYRNDPSYRVVEEQRIRLYVPLRSATDITRR